MTNEYNHNPIKSFYPSWDKIPFDKAILNIAGVEITKGIYDILKDLGIYTIEDFLRLECTPFISFKGGSESKWAKVEAAKQKIQTESHKISDYYKYCIQNIELPFSAYGNTDRLSTEESARCVIEQLKSILYESRNYDKRHNRAFYLLEDLLEGCENDDLLKEKINVKSRESIRKERLNFKSELRIGNVMNIPNIKILDDVIIACKSICDSEYRYKSELFLRERLGCANYEESYIKYFLDLNCVTDNLKGTAYVNFDQMYYIPYGEQKDSIKTYINTIIEIVSEEIRPISIQQMFDLICEKYPDKDYDIVLLESLVRQHTWLECLDDDFFQLKYEKLESYKQIARIIYEQKKVTRDKLTELLQLASESGKEVNLNSISNAKNHYVWIVSGQNGIYEYNPDNVPKRNIFQAIRDYINDKVRFEYDSLAIFLSENGYEINPGTIRTYALKLCQCSLDNNNLFCHSDYLDCYPNERWRAKTQNGITNWLIGQIVSIFRDKGKNNLPIKEVREKIQHEIANAPDQYNIKNDFISYLYAYIGDDKFFVISDKNLELTNKALSLSQDDLQTIGLRNRKPEYYNNVISCLQATLKSKEDGLLLLSDAKDICLAEFEDLQYYTFYKIIKHHLPKHIEKISINDKVYLSINKDKVEYESSYCISNESFDSVALEPTFVKENNANEDRSDYLSGQRRIYSWDELKQKMVQHFNFYKRWWDLSISLEDGVELFEQFVKMCDNNSRLKQLPQYIYEFYSVKNDIYDYYNYLSVISVNYERLLREIHRINTAEIIEAQGLMGVVKQIPAFDTWISNSDKSKGFRKSFDSLKYIRNCIAHGVDIDDSLLSLVQNTTNFIALYIYTVSKFLKQNLDICQ